MTKPCILAALAALALSGCSTPGPLHLYSIASGRANVHDAALEGQDVARDTPSYLSTGETLTGFAYDPYTDHFFLRLAPGNVIRVVDRPARKIKREETLDEPANVGVGDLAVSPRDGHLFLVDGTTTRVIEATRFGKLVRQITLQRAATPAVAIAYDMVENHLLVLGTDGRSVTIFNRAGAGQAALTLDRAVRPSLAYDGTKREFYAPLAGVADTVGIFDGSGRCVRQLSIPAGDQFIDVGPHSFLRMF